MPFGVALALLAIVAGFAAARAFQWKRHRDAADRRLEQKDLDSRRHHFRGALDMELNQRPIIDDPTPPDPPQQ